MILLYQYVVNTTQNVARLVYYRNQWENVRELNTFAFNCISQSQGCLEVLGCVAICGHIVCKIHRVVQELISLKVTNCQCCNILTIAN